MKKAFLKRAALAAALAAAFASSATQAQTITSYPIGTWTVSTTNPDLAKALEPAGWEVAGLTDPSEIASALQALATKKSGILSLDTRVDVDAKTIDIEAAPIEIHAQGAYADMFAALAGKPLTEDGLQAKARLAQEAARYDNKSVSIKLSGAASAGAPMSLDIQTQDATDSRVGGSVSLSTYGQRYSSRDLVTLSGYARLGGQTQIQATATEGLPNLRPDSRGGYYHSNSVEVDHVFSNFSGSLKLSDTRYKQGGDLLPFNMTGRVSRIDLDGRMPLSANSTALFGLGFIRQGTDFGTAGLHEDAQFAHGMLGYSYANGPFSASAKLYQGLGGSRSFNVAPLSGEFDPNFTALALEAKYTKDFGNGYWLDLAAAAQVGTKGTPSAMQFYGGGPDRGRAFITGNISGPSGVSASATLNKDLGNGSSAYVGIDAAKVYPAIGDAQSQSSLYVGWRRNLGHGATLDVGLSKPLSAPPGFSKAPQLSLMLNFSF